MRLKDWFLSLSVYLSCASCRYAFNPFLMEISYKGYGLGAWLKRPRVQFENPNPNIHKLFHLRVLLSFWVNLFNDGLAIFNPAPPPPPPAGESRDVPNLYLVSAYREICTI